ncbi:GNAT family N-acetyltransferase [Cohnella rhizosphaerae]|uniref:GNAT family N-acetyltransferase n=1 Tax=Cohnella rhizosphaerae TaxID=1457232 RepID=A0A9X4KXY3_9BACL|nr:GNAT family N-acetyltransferase [Cohnella rhizosphaerae]MDG0813351.1 GNAT family N-acetyltransferase [Cohnella rhizosphaerae]
MNPKPSKLVMTLDTLADLPPLALPEGYSLKSFESMDVTAWESIIRISFAREIAFGDKIGFEAPFHPDKILFIRHQGLAVATAVAWEKEGCGDDCGYLHMVGALPGHSGKRIGYMITLAALHRMREEGKKKAMLETDDFRLAAIRIYTKLGFRPTLLEPEHERRWNAVLARINDR